MNVFVETLVVIARVLKILFESILRWILPARYKSVEGEVCLITGAGSGIGRLMALHFAKRKTKLILWDINKKGNEETGEMVRKLGGSVFVDTCDVSDKEEIKKGAKRAREAVGDVTILVNNAGCMSPSLEQTNKFGANKHSQSDAGALKQGIAYGKELLQLTERQIEQTFAVNTFAHFWIVREFLPHMLETNHGHLVTVASTVGLYATPGMPDYTSSKHAAVGFHQSLYFDLYNSGKSGIKTTLVCPYLIQTGMFQGVNISKPWFFPPLRPEECAQAIMHAVLTERPFVAIPRTMYLNYNVVTWLPMEAQVLLYEFVGADRAISKLIPNRPYQHDDNN